MKVSLFLASASDQAHGDAIIAILKEFGVPVDTVILSAHKVPEKVFAKINELNASDDHTVIITCVGMSNGIGGLLAGSSVHPVISCPIFCDQSDYLVNIHSSTQMPSDVPSMTVVSPKNAALAAIKILALSDTELRKKVEKRIKEVKNKYE